LAIEIIGCTQLRINPRSEKVLGGTHGREKRPPKKLSELSEKVMALANSIRQAERDMQSTWIDEIEARDLQNMKERMKAVEETLCVLQEEVGHVEAEHCKKAKETH
jgi:hypothetical protein